MTVNPSHQPPNYDCPMCKLVNGQNDDINQQDCIVFQDEKTLAYISPKWWEKNPGHVLVIPKEHQENLYTISEDSLSAVYRTVKKIATAIKETYHSDGISTRQHNEPAGNQDVWHFHVHVFPRYINDHLYQNHDKQRWVTHEERQVFATLLQNHFLNDQQ